MTNSIFEYHRHKHTTSLQRITAITHTKKREREGDQRCEVQCSGILGFQYDHSFHQVSEGLTKKEI